MHEIIAEIERSTMVASAKSVKRKAPDHPFCGCNHYLSPGRAAIGEERDTMIMWSRLLLLNLRQNNCKVVTMQVQ